MIERFIAGRYLGSGKSSGFAYIVTWFSFIGIALGVATLIIVTSVMNGFRFELLEKIVGMKGHVIVYSANRSPISDYENVAEKIKTSCKTIKYAIPQIEQQVVMIAGDSAKGVLAYGMSFESLKSKKLLSDNIKIGSVTDFTDQGILIGKRMAENANLRVGDAIKLLIPEGIITPFGKLPKEEIFSIAGIFEVGMNEYDKNIIVMPLTAAQDFFSMKNEISQVEIFLDKVDDARFISQNLKTLLGDSFDVLDWRHSDASIFHAVAVEKNVMTLILSIIILVAVFNIISGLTMLTSSKTKDIAVLRTIGITKKSILKIFFFVGASVGILGAGTGLILGLLISLNIDGIKRLLEKLSSTELFNEE
ncbi:MAG: ABC transporter permease, partial [Holosporales bacterium]|nr:ABC transporter permease [Holosporales bacterium]